VAIGSTNARAPASDRSQRDVSISFFPKRVEDPDVHPVLVDDLAVAIDGQRTS